MQGEAGLPEVAGEASQLARSSHPVKGSIIVTPSAVLVPLTSVLPHGLETAERSPLATAVSIELAYHSDRTLGDGASDAGIDVQGISR